jgi:hypothetical protein
MITSFEVGSVFKIIDEASPALRVILKQVRELNVQLDRARASLTSLGKVAAPAGLTTAVTETGELAAAWGLVAKNAGAAQRAIGAASNSRKHLAQTWLPWSRKNLLRRFGSAAARSKPARRRA